MNIFTTNLKFAIMMFKSVVSAMMSVANSCLQYKTLETVEARIIMGESFSSCVWCRILSWLEGGEVVLKDFESSCKEWCMLMKPRKLQGFGPNYNLDIKFTRVCIPITIHLIKTKLLQINLTLTKTKFGG